MQIRLSLATNAAQDASGGFEDALRRDALGHGDAHFGDHLLGETFGELGAAAHIDVDRAGEEVIDDVEVIGREASDSVGGEIDGKRGNDRFGWGGGGEGGSGEGASGGAAPDGPLDGALVDDEGSGGEVAETLVALIAEHGDEADRVDAGHPVDDADEIARHGFEEGDLATGIADDAEFAPAFAGSLAVPEGFKEGEVAPVEEEMKEDDGGDHPFDRGGHRGIGGSCAG